MVTVEKGSLVSRYESIRIEWIKTEFIRQTGNKEIHKLINKINASQKKRMSLPYIEFV